ncbi:hypothetical protein E2C01_017948 [Portunus trituberculatus]|uniref:Uncharacterized protein n=1 Tax=Portunus trituberculatus TaxID=210409 RepID=A0A5B7DVE0_PORTR|nr:hypothetical protein [Portunus trituberculatus]
MYDEPRQSYVRLQWWLVLKAWEISVHLASDATSRVVRPATKTKSLNCWMLGGSLRQTHVGQHQRYVESLIHSVRHMKAVGNARRECTGHTQEGPWLLQPQQVRRRPARFHAHAARLT